MLSGSGAGFSTCSETILRTNLEGNHGVILDENQQQENHK